MAALFDHRGPWRTAKPEGLNRRVHPEEPWGVRQMRPFSNIDVQPSYRVVIDAETQTARYIDRAGRPIEAGKHRQTKSYTEKRDSTRTKPMDNQGPNDSDTDNSTVVDGTD
jgi:putative ATP-grasp target RiPP